MEADSFRGGLELRSSKDIPFTVIGIAPPGFFGETLARRTRPKSGFPCTRSRSSPATAQLLHQSVSAVACGVIGRLRPGGLHHRHGTPG